MGSRKKWVIFGFNVCASVFLGLCVYGILIYFESGAPRSPSLAVSALCAALAVGAIAGIGYFGRQWDLHNAREAREALDANEKRQSPPAPRKKGKRSRG